MDLIFWWMPLAWIAVIALAVIVASALRRRRRGPDAASTPIAHSSRFTGLPGYRRALVRYRVLLGAMAAAGVVLLLGAIVVSARPAVTSVRQPDLNSRDIVLCLDVSGSMIEYDAELVSVFSDLVDEFDGERISLVVFNASAVTYFPLTSDYDYVRAQFDTLREQFAGDELDFFDGTFFGDGSSLVGDGLAACSLRFDTPDQERSRSIVLATDNLVVGDPIFTLPEAGALAGERDIRVYGLNPGDANSKEYLDELAVEFENVVSDSGGAYFALADPEAVPGIVGRIEAEQAAAIPGAPQLIREDRPEGFVVAIGVAMLALLAFAWRVER
ncbi:MAG: hypothetical protein RI885_2577 [Actinomycetota bacterium]